MATEYDDSQDWTFFIRGPSKTLTNGNGFATRWSEQTVAALRSVGFLNNMVDGTVPPVDTSMLWLDKNTDPAVLKEYNPVGAAWEKVTSQTLFGRVPWRGAWDDEPIYRRADLVSYNGAIWIAILPSQNHPPAEDAYWDLFMPAVPDNSVTTPKLVNGAVTTPKLAPGILSFDTEAAFIAAHIDPTINQVNTAGYSAVGDGGGHHKVRIATPSPAQLWHKQSADGAWWQVAAPPGGRMDIRQLGAVCDNVRNDAAELLAVLAFGYRAVIPKPANITLSAGQVAAFMAGLNLVSPQVPMYFNLPAGDHAIASQVEVNSPDMRNVKLRGVVLPAVQATAIANTSAAAKNHAVKYTLSDASNVAVGDYLYIGYVVGTTNYRVAEGVFKVTAKSGNDVTVKHTYGKSAWPTMTVTDATVVPIKTILRWPVTQRGLAISGCVLGSIENLVLASQFNITTDAPSDSYSDGLQVGTAPDQLNTGSTESQQINAGAVWCSTVGFVEWPGNGVQVLGGSFYQFRGAACSNGWRGYQAGRGGSVGVKYSAAVGNGASGYEAEEGGSVLANGSVSAGNTEQGVYSISPGGVSFISGRAIGNGSNGLDARNSGDIQADGAQTTLNDKGIFCQAGKVVFGASASSSGNTTYDTHVDEGGIVDADGATTIGTLLNVDFGGNSQLIQADGTLYLNNLVEMKDQAAGMRARLNVSNIGDLFIAMDTGGGSYTNRIGIKGSSGVLYPFADNASTLGRSTERWSVVYAATGTINTSDETEKQDITNIEDMILDAWANVEWVSFRWIDAVAEKGDGARLHFGLIAQRVKAVFEANNIDPFSLGVVCFDEWEDEMEGGQMVRPAGRRYGLRYDQAFAIEAAYQRRRLDRLEAAVSM